MKRYLARLGWSVLTAMVLPYVPPIVGNETWAMALFLQIVAVTIVPLVLSVWAFEREGGW